jgi:BASS family bile acid:Na+ symporter
MSKIKKLLRNRNFILLLAAMFGLLLPQGSRWTANLTLPALAVIMSLSTMGVSGNVFRSPRSLIVPAILGILMSYVVLAGFILGIGAIIIHEENIWKGIIILAVVPPAVAIIPFTEYLNGNSTYSLIGTTAGYLGALIIMPLIVFKFLGSSSFDLARVPMITALLIIVPLVISRILLWKRIAEKIEPIKGTITNWSFFVVFYTIVGLNQDIFVGQPLRLVPVAAIAIASTFFLGLIIDSVGRLFRIDSKIATSLVLLGTLKNYGLAGGLALALFGKQTALPATVSTIFMFIYIVWLGFKVRRPV